MEEKLFTVQQAAAWWGVSEQDVYRWIEEGRLEPASRGDETRVSSEFLGIPLQASHQTGQQKKQGWFNHRLADLHRISDLGFATLAQYRYDISEFAINLVDKDEVDTLTSILLKAAFYAKRRRMLQEIFADIFGGPYPVTTFSLGEKRFRSGYHGDHRTPWMSLALVFKVERKHRKILPAESIKLPYDGNLILIGGPISTPATRHGLQYEGPTVDTQRRHSDPFIQLRFYPLPDKTSSFISKDACVGWQQEDGTKYSSNPWPIIDKNNPGDPKMPDFNFETDIKRPDGKKVYVPKNNYLLITCMKNFFSSDFSEMRNKERSACPNIIFVQGNNGIGTRGVELLARSARVELLLHIKDLVGDSNEFQLLFKLSKLEHSGRFHRFTRIELIAHELLKINARNYSDAREYALSQLPIVSRMH